MAEYGDFGGTDFGFGGTGLGNSFGAPEVPSNPYGFDTPSWGNDAGNYFDGSFSPLSSSYSDNGISSYSNPSYSLSGMDGNPDFNLGEDDRETRAKAQSSIMNNPLMQAFRNVTSLHPGARAAWGISDLVSGKNPMSVLAGQIPGWGGVAARGVADYAKNGNLGAAVGTQAGGTLGGMFGNAVAPGLGALTGPLGAQLGRTIGATPGINGNGQSQGQQNQFDVNSLLSGLGGLYSASRAGSDLGTNQSAINGQISSLSGMYGPDSPYAKQLRQQLERKDAASGRNSQYGPREAQLQALLADKAAGTAGTIGQLTQQSQKLNDQRSAMRGQQLASLLNLGQRSGLFNGLSGMFNSGSSDQNTSQPFFPPNWAGDNGDTGSYA